MTRPNLFIVGAAKCGTTAMHAYLGTHPEIYMSEPVKELHHFGADLGIRRGAYSVSRSAYLGCFTDGEGLPIVGESSPSYLLSRTAAAEIHAFDRDARIIIMLRDPVEVLAALHSQLRRNGWETVPDLRRALDEAGSDVPRAARVPNGEGVWFDYWRVVRFGSQVARYLHAFPREHVHVILHEDLVADARGVYRRALQFLDVADDHVPDLTPIHVNREARSFAVARLLARAPTAARALNRLPILARRAHRVRRSLRGWNLRATTREPVDRDLAASIRERVRPDVELLATLIDRDLSAWIET